MKTHTLEAGQFIEFINPWKEWNTEWNIVFFGNFVLNVGHIYKQQSKMSKVSTNIVLAIILYYLT